MKVPVGTQYEYGMKDRQVGHDPKDPNNAMYMSGWLFENNRLRKLNKLAKFSAIKEEEQTEIIKTMSAVNAVVEKLRSMGHKGIKVEENTTFDKAKHKFASSGWIVYINNGAKIWTDLIKTTYLKELLMTKIK